MGTIKSEVAFQTTSASRVKFVRIFVFVVAGMAGLLFGLDQGVISGALPFIAKEWELTSRLQEWVVSSMMVGAAIGAIIASKLSSGIGRKKSLMIDWCCIVYCRLSWFWYGNKCRNAHWCSFDFRSFCRYSILYSSIVFS